MLEVALGLSGVSFSSVLGGEREQGSCCFDFDLLNASCIAPHRGTRAKSGVSLSRDRPPRPTTAPAPAHPESTPVLPRAQAKKAIGAAQAQKRSTAGTIKLSIATLQPTTAIYTPYAPDHSNHGSRQFGVQGEAGRAGRAVRRDGIGHEGCSEATTGE